MRAQAREGCLAEDGAPRPGAGGGEEKGCRCAGVCVMMAESYLGPWLGRMGTEGRVSCVGSGPRG